jgi:23S rRNA pseudouridine2605 synthase
MKSGSRGTGKRGPQGTGKTQRTEGAKAGPGAAGKSGSEAVRLNKYIAASGICSRREADQLISAGLISVNGKVVSALGSKVGPADEVRYNGERIRNERKVYLVLNKPKDYVTTTDDPRERKTVMLLVKDACKERIYPVGRLDRNTTGVLLFTNDGELAKKMTHPSHNKKKIYHVSLNKGLSAGDLKKLADGISLDDGFIQPDAISYVNRENKREVGLEIHSGKNRIVRRMFEALGYRVDKLDRVYFGGLTKKSLSRGKWRFLTEKEVNRLKMNAYE